MGSRAALPSRTRRRFALLAAALAAVLASGTGLTAMADEAADTPSTTADPRPLACGDGSYDAEVTRDGNTWNAPGYSGSSMLEAMRAGVASLTPGRTSMESVVVRGSGDVPANQSLDLPSHTSLEVCGTLNVTGQMAATHAPIRVRNAQNVAIPYVENMHGAPYFGIFVQNAHNVAMGDITMELNGGLGIRVDNHGDTSQRTTNVSIDSATISGAGSHAVETYGVDGFTAGTITASSVGESGLLLNDTINADIGTIRATDVATGTGYAAFRMANRNGALNNYSTNIRVGEVIARGGGRGIFCVSQSGGAVIDRVDIADTGNNAILIENCYNVTIASQGGTISGGGEVRLAARSEFANNRDITLRGFTLVNSRLTENPCGENVTIDITFQNSTDNSC
ncbi:right-handed parallel beta-helix repeat-containing protein [Streptomyces triticirhizae]|uniref:Right-handed parallel beta-helix repeat-containing protein n=1 Tax=Streptomyces triticirhizae TaxID=2483353 RepID=A0A3M2LST7_9ACTN|nr:right-handed parallel beta-helix repeat-containing protein [Streptomyces triticirhizae]RMI40549.1 right-handed parallel beta-helix repeat-containing protein [Streptomyces triticirhizae]